MRITSKQWIFGLMTAAGIALAAWRTPAAFDNWKLSQESRVSDPSAAELYEVDLWFEIGLILVSLISVVGGAIVARQRKRAD